MWSECRVHLTSLLGHLLSAFNGNVRRNDIFVYIVWDSLSKYQGNVRLLCVLNDEALSVPFKYEAMLPCQTGAVMVGRSKSCILLSELTKTVHCKNMMLRSFKSLWAVVYENHNVSPIINMLSVPYVSVRHDDWCFIENLASDCSLQYFLCRSCLHVSDHRSFLELTWLRDDDCWLTKKCAFLESNDLFFKKALLNITVNPHQLGSKIDYQL